MSPENLPPSQPIVRSTSHLLLCPLDNCDDSPHERIREIMRCGHTAGSQVALMVMSLPTSSVTSVLPQPIKLILAFHVTVFAGS